MKPFKALSKILISADTIVGTSGTVAAASPTVFNLGTISTLVAIFIGILTAGFLISRWVLWSYNNRKQLSEINRFVWGFIKASKDPVDGDGTDTTSK